ncbi:MAG: NAD(P)H-hydrate dehydratase [Marmoricola sp.]|nr:NAD(P)H-hydrate dehydratase [Marmoricola sp.]
MPESPTTPELVTPELLRGWALPDPAGSKKARGQVVVVGGAARTPGGVALAGLAALRVGAGHVQLAVAASVAPAVAAAFPEVGVLPLPHDDHGSVLGEAAAEVCADAVAGADAVLVGPGLDDAEEAEALVRGLLPHLDDEAALVLDAYALGVLPQLRKLLDARRTAGGGRVPAPVLTPNSDELGRLLERDVEDEQADLLEAASAYSCVLSGSGTIAAPDGRLWRVPSGHSGLATAGSGDVLAGLVVGLLARRATPEQAASWGTYLHSTAGERLASSVGGIGFLARELVDQVPPVLGELA